MISRRRAEIRPVSIMHGVIRSGLPIAALATMAVSVYGQGAAFWLPPCDTVDVVAPRPYATEHLAPARGFVQVVPLGSDVPASADLGDLLDRAAGVSVRRYGGLGSMSLASVRGSSPSQVQIYIDDVPLSTASDAMANLALLPIRLFDRVEIASGPLSGGSDDAAAGSIRLVSPARFDAPLRFRASAGSFGTTSFSGAGGVAHGAFSFLAAGGRLSSRGDYPYLDRRGTRFESSDDRIVRRTNNAFHQEDLLVRALATTGNVQIETTGHGLWKDTGVPGTENLQTHHVRDRFRRWMQSLSVGSRGDPSMPADAHAGGAMLAPGASRVDWRLTLHRQADIDHYRNPAAEVGLGRADTRSRLIADGLRAALGGGPTGAALRGQLDATIVRERWTPEDRLRGTTGPTRRRLSRSAGIELAYRLGRATVSAAERVLFADEQLDGVAPGAPDLPGEDAVRRDRTLPHARVGASYELGGDVTLRGSWGQTLRLPTFTELYGQSGIQVGNPELVPERGTAWDIGANARWIPTPGLRTSIEAAVFETRTRQAIVWIQNSQRTTRAQNFERTRVRGAELLARGTLAIRSRSVLGLTATTTVQDARDEGPTPIYHGKRLPYQPLAQTSIQTRYENASIRLAHTIDTESSIERDRYNTPERRRGNRVLQDIEMTWKLPRRPLEATITVRNLADRRAQDVDGFPLPGRSVLIDLTWTVQ
jgi:iron complex outermembrane receptor protein